MGRILTWQEAHAWRNTLAEGGKRLVFTNGIFDLLHAGHLDYLERSRALGDALCVGVNSDASARSLKGSLRPVVSQADRIRLLAALLCVDGVIIFETETAEELVRFLHPNIYVKGGDWNLTDRMPPEVTVAQEVGAEVRFIPFTPERSTSALIERILQSHAAPASSPK